MSKVAILPETAHMAFAALIAISAGEEVDLATELALRDLGNAIAPEINIDQLIEAIKVGPK